MKITTYDQRFDDIIAPDAELTTLGTGFVFTEGPVWNPADKSLIFSDMPGDCMRRWTPSGGVEVFRQPSNMANGNAFDPQGRLLSCEHATSRVVRTELDGSVTELATHFAGKELNSPNDIIVRSDGAVYFTDPDFGRREFFGVPRPKDSNINGVYLVTPVGELHCLADDFEQPNGLCLSVDEKTLFVNDSPRRHIRAFDVAEDGTVDGGDVWAEVGGEGTDRTPDGMKVDSQDNLFCVGPGGIHVFDPSGSRIGAIELPESAANFAWGDDDLRGLYITATTSLFYVPLKVAGLPAYTENGANG